MMIKEEVEISQRLRRHQLLTSNYEADSLTTEGYDLPVLRMHNFEKLVEKGIQVRDRKNGAFGSSMLFSRIESLQNPLHWEALLSGIETDLLSYFLSSERIYETDSWNLAIQDTSATKEYKLEKSRDILSRKQKLRLFFYDLSNKGYNYNNRHYEFIDSHGNALVEEIKETVNLNLKVFVMPAVFSALTSKERKSFDTALANPANLDAAILETAKPALNIVLPKISDRLTRKIAHSIGALYESQRRLRFAVGQPVLKEVEEGDKIPFYQLRKNHSFFFSSSVEVYAGDHLESRLHATAITKNALAKAERMASKFGSS